MMRALAPWVLENPIFFHMTESSSTAVRGVLDQLKEVNGFLRNILNFNQGWLRDDDIQLWKWVLAGVGRS